MQRPATPCNAKQRPTTPCNALPSQLCAEVVAEGLLCSSPLAEHELPRDFPGWRSEEGSNAWFRQMKKPGVMGNMALNTVNHYGAQGSYYSSDFGNYFGTYKVSSDKPLLISEYGFDAYQTQTFASSATCERPPCLVMDENDESRTAQVTRPATRLLSEAAAYMIEAVTTRAQPCNRM